MRQNRNQSVVSAAFETLENRQLLSVTNSVAILGGPDYRTLRIAGSDKQDYIAVKIEVNSNGTMDANINLNGKLKVGKKLTNIKSVQIEGRGGKDEITVDAKGFLWSADSWVNIYAGLGNDTVAVTTDGNTRGYVQGGSGNDTVTVTTNAPVESEDICFNSTMYYNLILQGGNGNDTLIGGSGDDQIYGGKGNDLICGNSGDDQLYGDAGIDNIWGCDGDDQICGGDGNDVLHGGDDNDQIFGENGDDQIFGDNGENYLSGGIGKNTVTIGEAGNVYVDGGDDIIYGSAEDDFVSVSPNGHVVFYGGDGDDVIWHMVNSTDVLYDVESNQTYADPGSWGKG